MARCDDLLLIMFSIMIFIVRDDSFISVNLLPDINAHYINVLTLKCPQNSISEHLFFQNLPGGHAARPPSISMLHMLIVLHTMELIPGSLSLSYALLSGR